MGPNKYKDFQSLAPICHFRITLPAQQGLERQGMDVDSAAPKESKLIDYFWRMPSEGP